VGWEGEVGDGWEERRRKDGIGNVKRGSR
jgi:hypothetical protein